MPYQATITAPAGAAAARGGSRRLSLALLVIATAQLMVVLDATIVNVALPHIQRSLGFSGSGLEWVINAYALAFGGLLLLGGRAADLLGRRRMFVIGLLLFSAASLAGGLATSQAWLLVSGAAACAGGMLWLAQVTEHGTYAGELLGPGLLIGVGLGLLFMPLPLVALADVGETDSGVAASLLNTGRQVGGSIGLAILGTVAWTVVADSMRAAAAGGAGPDGRAAVYTHALAAGFDRAFLVAAGIGAHPRRRGHGDPHPSR